MNGTTGSEGAAVIGSGERPVAKIRSFASRFHHRIAVPVRSLNGRNVVSAAAEDGPFRGQLLYQTWTISEGPGSESRYRAALIECISGVRAQEALNSTMGTIANPSVDKKPITGGPGDLFSFVSMARDNVQVIGASPDFDQNRIQTGLGAVDAYLLSNWPLAAAEHSGVAMEPLEVEVSVAKQVKREEETELRLTVKQRGQRLPLDGLSFRVLMEPGRLRWDDGRLLYWSSQAGPATITADVFVEPSAYGQGHRHSEVELVRRCLAAVAGTSTPTTPGGQGREPPINGGGGAGERAHP